MSPVAASTHVAFRQSALVEVDEFHCALCSGGYTYDNYGNVWCSTCDADFADMLAAEFDA